MAATIFNQSFQQHNKNYRNRYQQKQTAVIASWFSTASNATIEDVNELLRSERF